MEGGERYKYIISIIHYLNSKYAIDFFISPKDFDLLMRWSEKKIPLNIIKKSIDRVVTRWLKKNKPVSSFVNFSYEVNKQYSLSADLDLGKHLKDRNQPVDRTLSECDELERFVEDIPAGLKGIAQDLLTIHRSIKENVLTTEQIECFYSKLTEEFKDDFDLNLKTKKFLNNLTEQFRNEQMKKQFQINYLLNRFNIPFLEGYVNG